MELRGWPEAAGNRAFGRSAGNRAFSLSAGNRALQKEGNMHAFRLTMTLPMLALLSTGARAAIVTVAYEARAATVAGKPFGLTVPLDTVVTGYFTFDTSTPDTDDDPMRGEYPHTHNSAFVADFLETEIRGSHTAFYEVQLSGSSPSDTFRAYDGPRVVGNEGGTMSIDGTPDEDVQLFLAITDDAFLNDDLIDPFPAYTFGFLGTPHTFSLKDTHGTMLLQFTRAVEARCGDPNNSGTTTAGDALQVLKTAVGTLECLPCVCDGDGNGVVASTDALKVLRFAVSGATPLQCSACL